MGKYSTIFVDYKVFEQKCKKKNVTSNFVAVSIGVPASTLSSWKKGICEPKLDKVYLLSKFFNCPIEDFIKEKKVKI